MNYGETIYISDRKKTASKELAHLLNNYIQNTAHPWTELVFLCIGSDRITGDSLGPVIGHKLSKYTFDAVYIYGTLHTPVHALNLSENLDKIRLRHPQALIIAIDASLGTKRHLGFITISNSPICPGAGVNKKLPEVGDISITGIVNLSGSFEHLLLQTTRLSTVIRMADIITEAILMTVLPHPYSLNRRSAFLFQERENARCLYPEENSSLAAFSSEAISDIMF